MPRSKPSRFWKHARLTLLNSSSGDRSRAISVSVQTTTVSDECRRRVPDPQPRRLPNHLSHHALDDRLVVLDPIAELGAPFEIVLDQGLLPPGVRPHGPLEGRQGRSPTEGRDSVPPGGGDRGGCQVEEHRGGFGGRGCGERGRVGG